MALVSLERNRATFEEKIKVKDPKTQQGYKTALNNFENYCMEKYGKIDIIDEIKNSPSDTIWDILQGWINWNNSRQPRTIINWFSKIKKYLHHRGIKLDQQDIKENIDFPTILYEEYYPLQLDEINTILKEMRYKHRAQFICQASSLMRIGELVQIRKKHLILDSDRIIVKIPANIAKLKMARTTFFSKEASKLLRIILRKKEDDDLVFGTNEDSRMSEINTEQILRRILEKTGLNMRYESSNRYKINTHSFRAYGITKISRHDPNFAKIIAGQKGYLIREYDRLSSDEKFELYKKYESDLLIDDSAIKQAELEAKSKKITELEKMQVQNQMYEDKITRQEQVLENVLTRLKKLDGKSS